MSQAISPVKVALGADFLTAFSRLPQKQQRKTREFLDKFTTTPDGNGLNYEKIHAARDPNLRSVRIDQNYRAIVLAPPRGNVHVILWVDKHDDAYHWAERRTCAVHPETGTMQVVLTEEAAADELAKSPLSQPALPISESAPPAPAPPAFSPDLFAHLSDEQLLSLSVPPSFLPHVREVSSDAALDRLEAILPREAFEALFLLAAGYSLEEARRELGIARASAVDTTDFAAAVERDSTRRQFVVITEATEMEKILAAPLEQWRIFLHPSQRQLVEKTFSGPVRVLGSAGTGKTVVAMHRAAWLARHVCKPGEKVLFTTFTRNLATDISANLRKLCSHEEWERIEVINLDAWARRFLDKQQFSLRLIFQDPSAANLWDKALQTAAPEEFPAHFIKAEWDNVIQAQGIETWEAYMTASRAGRTLRLSREERRKLWPVFAEYRALLNEKGLCEPADAYRTAASLIAARNVSLPYRSVIVDEAQDFGNEAFRLIRSLTPAQPNDLFIVGDAHQRIYGHQVVLSRCGIDIRGRGRKLRINYRTTEELKNWATALLKGVPFDDLDAGTDDADGVRSLVHGEPPLVKQAGSQIAALEMAADHIAHLLNDAARPEAICFVARTNYDLDEAEAHFSKVHPRLHRIRPEEPDDASIPGLRLATIHRVKGLEFDHVILTGAPEQAAAVADASSEEAAQQRALLYVAATRARKSLLVCRVTGY